MGYDIVSKLYQPGRTLVDNAATILADESLSDEAHAHALTVLRRHLTVDQVLAAQGLATEMLSFADYRRQIVAELVQNGEMDQCNAEAAIQQHPMHIRDLFEYGLHTSEAWQIFLDAIQPKAEMPDEVWLTQEEGFLPGYYARW